MRPGTGREGTLSGMNFDAACLSAAFWRALTAMALIFGAPDVSAAKPAETAGKAAAAKPAAKPAAKKTAKPDRRQNRRQSPPQEAAVKKPGQDREARAASKTAAKPADKKRRRKPPQEAGQSGRQAGCAAARAKPPHAAALHSPRPDAAPVKAALSPIPILPTSSFSPGKPTAAPRRCRPCRPSAIAPPPPAAPRRRRAARRLPAAPLRGAESTATPAADVALVKQAIDLVRRGKTSDATALEKTISDPLARKLVEWSDPAQRRERRGLRPPRRLQRRQSELAERHHDPPPRRRRAVGRAAQPPRVSRPSSPRSKPITAKGKFALARALLAQGDDAGRSAARARRPGARTPARATSSAS